MSHRLSDLVRTANPVQDPEQLLESVGREDLFQEIRRRTGHEYEPSVVVQPPADERRRWRPAIAAAAALIAAIALAIVFANSLADNEDVIAPSTTLPAPGESDSPVEVVNAFISKWNERDVEGALAYLHPETLSGRAGDVGSGRWWQNMLNYSVAAYGGDWKWVLRDCSDLSETTAQCRLGIAGEPLYDALLIPAVRKQWDIRDGLLIQAPILFDVSLADAAADRYARDQDPEGHAAACSIEGRELLGELIVYDATCGAFMAPHRLAYAAELLGSQPPARP